MKKLLLLSIIYVSQTYFCMASISDFTGTWQGMIEGKNSLNYAYLPPHTTNKKWTTKVTIQKNMNNLIITHFYTSKQHKLKFKIVGNKLMSAGKVLGVIGTTLNECSYLSYREFLKEEPSISSGMRYRLMSNLIRKCPGINGINDVTFYTHRYTSILNSNAEANSINVFKGELFKVPLP